MAQKLRFVEGEKIPFLGRSIELQAVSGRCLHYDEARGVLDVPVEKRAGVSGTPPEAGVKKTAVVRFFETRAREVFEPLVKRYATIIGRSASHVSVRAMKSRWGSCSSTGRLSLNWRILCAPPEVAEYPGGA